MPAGDGEVRIPEQLGIVVGMQVYETGSHYMTFRVKCLFGLMVFEASYIDDRTIFHANVASVTRHPHSVDDHSVFDH